MSVADHSSPPTDRTSIPKDSARPTDESDFLRLQAADALAEIRSGVGQIAEEFQRQLNPAALVRRRPTAALGACAVIGVGLGYLLARPGSPSPSPAPGPSNDRSWPTAHEQGTGRRMLGLILQPLFASLVAAGKLALDRLLQGLVESAQVRSSPGGAAAPDVSPATAAEMPCDSTS